MPKSKRKLNRLKVRPILTNNSTIENFSDFKMERFKSVPSKIGEQVKADSTPKKAKNETTEGLKP